MATWTLITRTIRGRNNMVQYSFDLPYLEHENLIQNCDINRLKFPLNIQMRLNQNR